MSAAPRLPISITVDTREQTPLEFDPDRVVTVRGTVPVFDYALTGDEAAFAVERKSLADFVGSCITGWDRERGKLARARAAGIAPLTYVVEGRFSDLLKPATYRWFVSGAVTPALMMLRWRHLQYVERVSVVFACDRVHAARAVYGLLKVRYEWLKENT